MLLPFRTLLNAVVGIFMITVSLAAQGFILPAGAKISAVATAYFFDPVTGDVLSVASNHSGTIIAPVPAMRLDNDQTSRVGRDQTITFIHRLINTGNVEDRYHLSVLAAEKNKILTLSVSEYQQATLENTQSENESNPILTTPVLQPGESITLLIQGVAAADEGQTQLLLSARSGSNEALIRQNNNTVIFTGQSALIDKTVNKTVADPGETLVYTLSLKNTGKDLLPEHRGLEVDRQLVNALLLEDQLPVSTQLTTRARPTLNHEEAEVVVWLRDERRWVSYDAWDKSAPVTRIGAALATEKLPEEQILSMSFQVIIRGDISHSLQIENQAYLRSHAGQSQHWLTSHRVYTKIKHSGKPGVGENEGLRFLTAVGTPSFLGTFTETGYYPLTSKPQYEQQENEQHDLFLEMRGGGFNVSNEEINGIDVKLTSATGSSTTVQLIQTGLGSRVFRSQFPLRLVVAHKNTPYCGDETKKPDYSEESLCFLSSRDGDQLSAVITNQSTGIRHKKQVSVNPRGVVFDTKSAQLSPVKGAQILFTQVNGRPAIDRITKKELLPIDVSDGGWFSYPLLMPGDYFIAVTPPAGYVFPSSIPSQHLRSIRRVTEASYGLGGYQKKPQSEGTPVASAFYKGTFTIRHDQPFRGMDIPVDPADTRAGFILEKQAKQDRVAPGGAVVYELRLSNHTGVDLYALEIEDDMPKGFRFIKGSLRINGERAEDPEINAGRLTFLLSGTPSLAVGNKANITYALQAGASSLVSDGINRARAVAKTFPASVVLRSNEASATVKVAVEGVLSDRAILFGKVYMEGQCSGTDDLSDIPIAGVRLYMDDGTWVSTDQQGLYSLMGLQQGNRVIKVDPLTLPEGFTLKAVDTRHAGDGRSRFVDLAVGDMHRADFVARCDRNDYESAVRVLAERSEMLTNNHALDNLLANYHQFKKKVGRNGDESSGGDTDTSILPELENGLVQGVISDADSDERVKQIAMPSAVDIEKTATYEQGRAGTWVWPQGRYADGRFMVVVRSGVEPLLYVNGVLISKDQLGEQLIANQRGIQVLAWYGVPLEVGVNELEVKASDMFGNERIMATRQFIKPGQAVRIQLIAEHDTLPADGGKSTAEITVKLLDRNDEPTDSIHFINLNASDGEWVETDLRHDEPGHQVRIDNGVGKVHLRSGTRAKPVTITATSGQLKGKTTLLQVTVPRPLIAVGLVDINTGHDGFKH